MKKMTVTRLCCYGLLIISSTVLLSANNRVLTQTANRSPVVQTLSSSSKLIWPAQGIISQGFSKYNHEGIDIAGALGTPILAAATGTIIKAGWDNWGLGNAIKIQHPDGSITVYGHNSRLLVKQGQSVSQGQIIAEMGSTGNSTAPHLHFEVHPNPRVALNPINVLPSLVAGKIPTQQKVNTAAVSPQEVNPVDFVSPYSNTRQVSPSQQIPVAFGTEQDKGRCNGEIVIQGETANFIVKVCEENGNFFYIGQSKQEPDKPVKLFATIVGTSKYKAENGSYSYLVNPNGVEVWQNGHKLRSDRFYGV
ncbi:MAG: M23 family metallopeptidase [Scytonema sp. PMC 1069.18]|nr:M23 family metallopeptidase [Scytonema sp. PMC 1069.18]MEC4884453.1 M23 family metallopeptidase [Scytonema sp. PMC 1070.18]